MNRGAMAFLKISAAGYTLELPPRVAARMTVGTEVAAPHPAVIRTIRVGTEMMRHVDRAPTSSCEDEAGWRGRGGWWVKPGNGLGSLERFWVALAGLEVG